MSFTITCDKCQQERVFSDTSSNDGDENINILVFMSTTYRGDEIISIDVKCTNPVCENNISMEQN